MMKPVVKALLFDVQGTATDFHSTVCGEAQRISAGRHTGVDWPDLVRRWRAGYFAALEAARSHHDGWVSVHSVYRDALETVLREFGITLHGMDSPSRGIVHVIGPELGLTQPGMTVVCGDSHTSTHGAFGALAFGIGTSEVEHVLATQCLLQRRPKTLEVRVDGHIVPKSDVDGWTYLPAERSIRFQGNAIPRPGADVRISYDVAR